MKNDIEIWSRKLSWFTSDIIMSRQTHLKPGTAEVEMGFLSLRHSKPRVTGRHCNLIVASIQVPQWWLPSKQTTRLCVHLTVRASNPRGLFYLLTAPLCLCFGKYGRQRVQLCGHIWAILKHCDTKIALKASVYAQSFERRESEKGKVGMNHAYVSKRALNYAISRKVAGSRPDEVNEFFQFTSSFQRTRPWDSSLPELSTRNIKIMFLGSRALPVRRTDNLAVICALTV
jgi:hypothetical protein